MKLCDGSKIDIKKRCEAKLLEVDGYETEEQWMYLEKFWFRNAPKIRCYQFERARLPEIVSEEFQ